jgi:hypothetical protein
VTTEGVTRTNSSSLLKNGEDSSSISSLVRAARLGLSDANEKNVDVDCPIGRDSSCAGRLSTFEESNDILTGEGVLALTRFALGLGGDGHIDIV